MDETAPVLHRLERIETFDASGALRDLILDELRALVGEAEACARAGADRRPDVASTELREGAEGMR